MKYLGNYTMSNTVRCYFNTHKADGTPATLSGSPAIAVYRDSTTESTAGVTLYVDYDGVTGYNCAVIDMSADSSFYTYEKDYSIVITAGTVDGISVAGTEVGCFSILHRYSRVNAIASNAISNATISDGALSWSKFASDYSTNLVSNIWSATTRTLTSFGSLVSDVVSGVWSAGTRTLTSFGTLASDIAFAVWSAGNRTLTLYPDIGDSPGVITLLNRVIGTIAAGTHYPQSGDSYARIGANGSGLTNLGDSRLANLDATVSSRLAGSAYTPPDNASVSAIKSTTDKLNTTVELDGSTWRFTANALEMAPSSGGSGLTPSQEQTLADLAAMIEGDGTPSARFTLNALSNAPAGEGGGGTVVIVSGDQSLTITDPMEPYHTVEKVVSEVQLTFPDVDQSVILDCINRVHQDLCAEYPVYRATQRIDLVAGQREYPIASSAQAVRRARYLPSDGSYIVLEPCGVADLDVEEPGWAWQNPGQPYRFYIDGGFIGIDPIPSESTDADYPRVDLDIVWAVPLTLTDRLPASIKSRQVYVQGAKRFIAEWAAADKLGMYETLYNKEFQDVERYMGRRNRQYKTKATPSPGGFGFHQV